MYLVGRFGDVHIDITIDEPPVPPGYVRVYMPCAYHRICKFTIYVPESQKGIVEEMITRPCEFDIYAVESWNRYITRAIDSGSGLFQDWLIMYELRVLLDGCTILCKTMDSSPSVVDYMRMITTYDQIVKNNFPMLTKCDGNKYAFEMMTFYELLKRIDEYKCVMIIILEVYDAIHILAKTDVNCPIENLELRHDTRDYCIRRARQVIAGLADIDDFIISPYMDQPEIGMNYPDIVVEFLSGFLTLSNAAMQQIYGDIGQIPATDYVYDSKSLHSIK